MKQIKLIVPLLILYAAGISYAQVPQDYYNRGYVYAEKGNVQDAIDEFSAALKLQPDKEMKTRIHYNLGQLHTRMESHSDAVQHFKAASELEPNQFLIQIALANAYKNNENFAEAIPHYNKALVLDESRKYSDSINYNLGICYNSTEQYIDAIKSLGKILDKDSNHTGALRQVAIAYLHLRQYVDAEKILNKLEHLGHPQRDLFLQLQQAQKTQ
ncbi:MAG: tetratricopeptide repeat protein [Candidatus Auribacterota bacterium]|jgi:tetratricopeptide (TPR) repeat protein|uniref:Tetratricopeptide repeat protein n=1 Tax=Candidatus Auribacter fodinae TaxID=2093366 RepID=A0A3A4R5S3_9BACT|nr:MAG: tetratricopeptide repeat protein [Candidatus Auribacter fodinae]